MAGAAKEASVGGAEGFDPDDLEGSKAASKKQKVVDEGKSIDTSDSDYEIYKSDSDYETEDIKKQFYVYNKQIAESEGFDVDPATIPNVPHYGGIRVLDLNYEDGMDFKDAKECLKLGIQEYNQREGVNLELEKILRINVRHGCGIMFYITFDAKDSGDPNKQVKTYQCQAMFGADTGDEEWGYHVILVRAKSEK